MSNISNKLKQGAEVAEASEFIAIFGSNANAKWFEWLMLNSGDYLFTGALFIFLGKFFLNVYQYIKNPNKNINEKSSLAWNALQTALIGTAITGALLAVTAFALATPILFVTALAADTIRNIGFLIWNTVKLAELYLTLSNQLDDPLTALKYEALKDKYTAKIWGHLLGSVIGLTLTAAAAVIFLLPQLGLSAVGATAIAIAGFKLTTVAGLVGTLAGAALSIPLIPLAYSAGKWCSSKIRQGFNTLFRKKQVDQEPLLNETPEQFEARKKIQLRALLPTNHHDTYKITTESAVQSAIEHTVDFDAFSKHSRLRETIIDHIVNEELAISALNKMLNKKLKDLTSDLSKGKEGSYKPISEWQRPKRLQKLKALLLLKLQLNPNDRNKVITKYQKYFDGGHYCPITHKNMTEELDFIEKNLPGVKKSFFLEQSDTDNIIQAFKVYNLKFLVKHTLSPSLNSRSGA